MLPALGPSWLDPDSLIQTFGFIGVLLIVFAETGLLVGFFLPGDSLLFTVGLLIAAGVLDIPLWLACLLITLAAIIGDQVGYTIGRKGGPHVFNRPESRFFRHENVERAQRFFDRYGPRTIVLARFVPIVRTFAPVLAGVAGMRYRTFVSYNVVGGMLWGTGVTLLGHWLGSFAVVRENIEVIALLIVAVSFVPIGVELLRARRASAGAAAPR